MKNILDKKVKGNLFKGSTNREFCDRVLDYFVPAFRKPILYIHNNGFATFQSQIGQDNLSDFKLYGSDGLGQFYLICNERDGRRFKTQLLPEMVQYIISELTNRGVMTNIEKQNASS